MTGAERWMIGVGVLVSTVVGVQLGRSAIGAINPMYYSPMPATRFYADLTPQGYAPAQQQPADVPTSDLAMTGGTICANCPVNFVEPLYARDGSGVTAGRSEEILTDREERLIEPPRTELVHEADYPTGDDELAPLDVDPVGQAEAEPPVGM